MIPFGWVDGRLDARFARIQFQTKMHGKLEKLTERLLAKLRPANLVNSMEYFNVTIHKLCKIQFWKNYLPTGFPCNHCNF